MKILCFWLILAFALPVSAQVNIGGTGVQIGGSGGMDILSNQRPSGTLAYAKNEYVSLASGTEQNLVNYTGGSPGYVSRVFIAATGGSGTPGGSGDPTQQNIKIYLNGSGTPYITIPFANMFLDQYAWDQASNVAPCPTTSYFTKANCQASSQDFSGDFTLPIPFNTGIRITYTNSTGSTLTFFSVVEYHTGVPLTSWTTTRVLHMDSIQRQTGIVANAVVTLSNYTGGAPGRFVGLWWMEDSFIGSVSPLTAPFEGNILLYLDGAGSPNIQSSGTEDWFGLGFGFGGQGLGGTGGGNSSSTQGGWCDGTGQMCLEFIGATFGNTQAAVRWHVNDPIDFSTGEKITWQCGDTSEVSFTGTCTLWSTVFYYTQS